MTYGQSQHKAMRILVSSFPSYSTFFDPNIFGGGLIRYGDKTVSRRGIRLLLSRPFEKRIQVNCELTTYLKREKNWKGERCIGESKKCRQDCAVDFESDIYLIFCDQVSRKVFYPHLRTTKK
jgi:hypothetical protein